MGIPSYYKKLCDRIPGLLSKQRKGDQPSHLWIDFNCMVYHCMRKPGAKPYEGEETRIEWENQLIREVCLYCKKIVSLVNPSVQVFIGVDGVVPMAKMRQQRLRRFKSHWTAAEERRIGKSEGGPRWDSNAITPGTAFMERLGEALQSLRGNNIKWTVSTAEEPGEGEHKVMKAMRQVNKTQSIHVVYGLDADLILLSLLQPIQELYLFREAVECGEVQYNQWNEEEYRYFSIHKLREYLCQGKDSDYLLDYCMAMSFVGNDFLPHGLSLKLKDGGHDILLQMLKEVRQSKGSLITGKKWRKEALIECLRWLSSREGELVQLHCNSKIKQRFQQARGSTSVELAIDEWNKMPLRDCEELALVGPGNSLKEGWKSIYRERWLGSGTYPEDTYLAGLDWILQYYLGNDINKEWCYPWFLPPLWSDLLQVLESRSELLDAPLAGDSFVKPQEQLAMVLPLESYWLIRDKKLRELPKLASQLWPSSFKLFTAGHKQTWECEAQIPLFFPSRLRYLLSQRND